VAVWLAGLLGDGDVLTDAVGVAAGLGVGTGEHPPDLAAAGSLHP
jgi:sorbitol-specific phosphotransferase system component IIBC